MISVTFFPASESCAPAGEAPSSAAATSAAAIRFMFFSIPSSLNARGGTIAECPCRRHSGRHESAYGGVLPNRRACYSRWQFFASDRLPPPFQGTPMRKPLALTAAALASAILIVAAPDHPAWSQAARTIRVVLTVPPG